MQSENSAFQNTQRFLRAQQEYYKKKYLELSDSDKIKVLEEALTLVCDVTEREKDFYIQQAIESCL